MSLLGGIGDQSVKDAVAGVQSIATGVEQTVTENVKTATDTIQQINSTDIAALADLGGQILSLLRAFGNATVTTTTKLQGDSLVNTIQIQMGKEVPSA